MGPPSVVFITPWHFLRSLHFISYQENVHSYFNIKMKHSFSCCICLVKYWLGQAVSEQSRSDRKCPRHNIVTWEHGESLDYRVMGGYYLMSMLHYSLDFTNSHGRSAAGCVSQETAPRAEPGYWPRTPHLETTRQRGREGERERGHWTEHNVGQKWGIFNFMSSNFLLVFTNAPSSPLTLWRICMMNK